MPPPQTCRKLVIKRGSPMRTITALFVGLGSIGTRHLKNLTNLCADRGWTLQADALRSDLSRPLRDGVAALLHAQYTDLADAPAHYDMVFITNPTSLHADALTRVRGRGGALFIEKPIFSAEQTGLDLADCLPAGQKAYVAAPMRWCGVMLALKALLAERMQLPTIIFDEIDTVTPYEDDGYVRSDIDRPAMNQLREDVADGLLDCVVIYRIDRVCSDMMDFCTFYTFLKERGVKFVTVKDGIDTTTPIGEAMMYLAVIFSGLEIGNDAIRIRDNLNHLAARGFWCGGQPPIGYDIQEIDLGGTTSPSSRWRPTAKITGSSRSGDPSCPRRSCTRSSGARTAWPTRRRSMTILRKRAASWTKEVPGSCGTGSTASWCTAGRCRRG